MQDDKNGFHKVTLASLLVALGIIYGDIGTSPLYVLKAVVGNRTIDETLVFGGVSLIFWTLFFQTTIKYIWLTLQADNHGEGGVFSLFALVKRYSKGLAIVTILGATTLLADGIDFVCEMPRVHHHPVADDRELAAAHDAGGQQG